MKSEQLGQPTSVEVSNVSKTGFWLLIGDKERFLPFADFPWFRKARVRELVNVELQSPNHLYWPDLDVDLAVESIDHPERFPLVSRAPSNRLRILAARDRKRTKSRNPASRRGKIRG